SSRVGLGEDQGGPCGLIPGPRTWKKRNAFVSTSSKQPPSAWHVSTAAMLFAAAIVFHAPRFFTNTKTTGHQVDWTASWSSITMLCAGSTAPEDPAGTECERSIVWG